MGTHRISCRRDRTRYPGHTVTAPSGFKVFRCELQKGPSISPTYCPYIQWAIIFIYNACTYEHEINHQMQPIIFSNSLRAHYPICFKSNCGSAHSFYFCIMISTKAIHGLTHLIPLSSEYLNLTEPPVFHTSRLHFPRHQNLEVNTLKVTTVINHTHR